jgi:hypothetical protein
MTEKEQQRATIESLAVVGVLAVFVALALAAATGRWRQVVETIVFLGAIGALLSHRSARRLLIKGLMARTAVLFLFVGAAIVAQFGGTQHVTFPFVSWRMFPGGVGNQPVRYIALNGVRPNGEAIAIQGHVLFPSLHQARYQNLLEKWTRRALHARQSGNPTHEETFEELMRAIGRAHNNEFPQLQIDRLEVSQITLPIQKHAHQLEQRELWTMEGPF